ncbi:alpha-aspartyl dipeptidase [Tachypleus tridentatus]|uniref:alpha-aspartyl dipeptidase n=1 Tax=Tachypleus tridentatus TaxID=6853 RepID=UPI003FD09FD1
MSCVRRLLLISNSTQCGSGFLEYCSEQVKTFFTKYGVSKVLFVPYALSDYDDYTRKARNAFQNMGLELESIHEKEDPVQAVKEAQGIFIGGGNTFRLLKSLYDNSVIELITERVLRSGLPYMGSSAGTNVATVSICTTNDMPIVFPPSFKALGLVPFNINPHYIEPDPSSTHMGETREERIKQYHEEEKTPPVLGLKEGSMLEVEGDKAILQGSTGAKLFIRGQEPQVLEIGTDVSYLLKSDLEV